MKMLNSKPLRWALVVVGTVVALGGIAMLPIMVGVNHVRTEIDIARAPHEVFEYVTTPAHWPRWHPSSIAVQGAVDHSLLLGESVGEEFNVAGRHGRATWRVVSREADRRWSIEGTIDGHVAGVVTYTLERGPSGTHFTRAFDYPSRSILFAVVNAFVLRARIADESKTALGNLKRLLDVGSEAMPIARR